jgi:hypothetical protein
MSTDNKCTISYVHYFPFSRCYSTTDTANPVEEISPVRKYHNPVTNVQLEVTPASQETQRRFAGLVEQVKREKGIESLLNALTSLRNRSL